MYLFAQKECEPVQNICKIFLEQVYQIQQHFLKLKQFMFKFNIFFIQIKFNFEY